MKKIPYKYGGVIFLFKILCANNIIVLFVRTFCENDFRQVFMNCWPWRLKSWLSMIRIMLKKISVFVLLPLSLFFCYNCEFFIQICY